MTKLRTTAVVLAAGKSRRMGRNKLLLEVAGRTILDRVLDVVRASSVDEVIAVLGHLPGAIKPIVEAQGVKYVINADYERGMTSSFITGLRKVKTDAVFLVLGDQIGISSILLDEMTCLMESDPEALIVSPSYQGRRGHPVLFRRTLFHEFLDLGADETLRDLVLRHETGHRTVESEHWSILDIDTPEDFREALELWEKQEK
jgi:molybdenum cofactor cytidylyltransferase